MLPNSHDFGYKRKKPYPTDHSHRMPLYDAHCHWADQRLAGHWKSIDADLRKTSVETPAEQVARNFKRYFLDEVMIRAGRRSPARCRESRGRRARPQKTFDP